MKLKRGDLIRQYYWPNLNGIVTGKREILILKLIKEGKDPQYWWVKVLYSSNWLDWYQNRDAIEWGFHGLFGLDDPFRKFKIINEEEAMVEMI